LIAGGATGLTATLANKKSFEKNKIFHRARVA
jgi:hypothetical protein